MTIIYKIIDHFRRNKIKEHALCLTILDQNYKYDGDYVLYKNTVYFVSLKHDVIARIKKEK